MLTKPHKLSHEDMDRLRSACGRRDVDLTRSVFGPDSITWRVNREIALLGGGGCALFLQVAHPLVAAGVARFSNFKGDPLKRLYRTLELMLTITFSDAASAIGAAREIERMHRRVHGLLDAAVGPFPKGTEYDANDPDLQLWVHATLVETGLRVYEMFIGPLSEDEREQYYDESKVVALILGIPGLKIPRDWRRFVQYYRDTVESDALTISPAARDITTAIMAPDTPFGLKFVLPPVNVLSVGLLPDVIRTRYGLSWGTVQEGILRAAVLAIQAVIPLLPEMARFFPQAREAAIRDGLHSEAVRNHTAAVSV